ncbi:MAG: hypothetical protein K0Q76_554 [Panacagrimonas sp.]|nr:SirB2 family protein [Panacagrimonas sp.]MCC2655446.1 hypothetical protein [Panacagrimonas sp.]
MIDYYPQIKAVHVYVAVATGSLYLLRGLLAVTGRESIALCAPVRYASYSVDTVLLTSALMLHSMLPAAAFSNGWLRAKLLLIIVYIALGVFTLHRARGPRSRVVCYVLALTVFGFVYAIARRHHPWGPLAPWFG